MKIAILGFGQEGKAVLRFLKKTQSGIKPVILDKKRDLKYLSHLQQFDLIYRSPGVPYNLPQIQRAIKNGVKFSSATDLFFQHAKGTIIGVTGTKGKGTTSALIYKILKNAGYDVYLGGNIGRPAVDLLPKLRKNSITVLELSSFQLQDLKYSPHIAAVLDIFPDHLDAHKNFKEYLEAKTPITKYQARKNFVFYFSDNKYSKLIAWRSRGKKIPVRAQKPDSPSHLAGPHNLKNVAMAVAVAKHFKVPEKIITATVKQFRGLPYRLQLTRSIDGIRFYNDSASTNPETTAAAIRSFPNQPKIIIMGGKDKGLDYRPLTKILEKEEVRLVVLFGENKEKIKKQLSIIKKRELRITEAKTMEEAVKTAYRAASSLIQDTRYKIHIILSPGAASFDMFENYKARGKAFEKIVRGLK